MLPNNAGCERWASSDSAHPGFLRLEPPKNHLDDQTIVAIPDIGIDGIYPLVNIQKAIEHGHRN